MSSGTGNINTCSSLPHSVFICDRSIHPYGCPIDNLCYVYTTLTSFFSQHTGGKRLKFCCGLQREMALCARKLDKLSSQRPNKVWAWLVWSHTFEFLHSVSQMWSSWDGGELLLQVKEFKNLRVLFISWGRAEWIWVKTVMQMLYHSVVARKGSWAKKVKLWTYKSIYIPSLTCGHELWVVTEGVWSWMQAAFFWGLAVLTLRVMVRSTVIQKKHGVESLLLHIRKS